MENNNNSNTIQKFNQTIIMGGDFDLFHIKVKLFIYLLITLCTLNICGLNAEGIFY